MYYDYYLLYMCRILRVRDSTIYSIDWCTRNISRVSFLFCVCISVQYIFVDVADFLEHEHECTTPHRIHGIANANKKSRFY